MKFPNSGKLFRLILLRSQMTDSEFAKYLGASYQHLWNMKWGRSGVPVKYVKKFLKFVPLIDVERAAVRDFTAAWRKDVEKSGPKQN